MLFVPVVFLLTADVFLKHSVWLEYPLSMFESGRRMHLCAVHSHTNILLPSQLFLSGASSYPGSQAHLKLPNVLTHLCSQPPLSGFRHSSSSVLIRQTLVEWTRANSSPFDQQYFATCVRTFEEVCSKACFIHRPIRDKFHPEGVGGGTDVFRFIIAAESTNQRAVLRQSISDF